METVLVTYFTVPGHYTQDFEGKRDQTFEAALERAKTRVVPLGRGLEGYSREFVDERHVIQKENGQSDQVVRRWEVFHDGTYVLMKDEPDA